VSQTPDLIICNVCGQGVYRLAYICPNCDAPRGVFDTPLSVRIKRAKEAAAAEAAAKKIVDDAVQKKKDDQFVQQRRRRVFRGIAWIAGIFLAVVYFLVLYNSI